MTHSHESSAIKEKMEIMDIIEAALIKHMEALMSEAGTPVTPEQARTLIGKIGCRIVFGKEVFISTMQ